MFIGFCCTLANFLPGITKPDRKKLKIALLVFIGTWLAIITISAIEFYIA